VKEFRYSGQDSNINKSKPLQTHTNRHNSYKQTQSIHTDTSRGGGDNAPPSSDGERLDKLELALVETTVQTLGMHNRRRFWLSCPNLRSLTEELTGERIDLEMNSWREPMSDDIAVG
jgi:hypothetical protein